MKRSISLFVLLFVVVLSFVFTAAAADKALYEDAIHTARREIWKTLSSGQASSATVAIMDDGRIVYSEGFGMRDREKGLPVTRNTQFNIGSISKIFTAAAILLLVDGDKVQLNKPVTTYLPNFTTQDERYKDITVRTLLNHTSGLPGTNPKDGFGSQKNPNHTAETLSYLAAEGIKHTPGQISVYCNDGFTVAEAVVEAASQMSYADFLSKRIFKPMMMRNSSCFFKDGNTNIALAYSPNTGLAMPVEYVSVMGSGGISSTPEDLCRYSTVLYKNRLFSENSLSEYTRAQYGPETVPDGGTPAFNCGLGWDSVAVNKFANQGVTVLAKNGGTQEFSSQLYVVPKEKLSIALIFTGAGVDTMTVTSTIMQTLLEEKGIVPHDGGPKLPPADAVIPAQLLTYAGFYASNSSIYKVEFDQSSSTMKLFSFAGSAFSLSKTLQYKSDGFFYSDTGGRIFLENRNQTNYLLTFQGSDTTGDVFAEGISPGATGIDASAFAGKQWLFRNASNYDFTVGAAETGTVAELPGYVHLRNGTNYMLTQLQSSDRAGMCLKYARDILGLSVVANNGQNWLELGRFLYSESQGISALADGESLVIGAQGLNEWRQSQNQAIFDCSIPSSGRIIVLTGDLQPRYDSLTAGSPPPLIVNTGDYVSFIGKTGDAFAVKLSRQ